MGLKPSTAAISSEEYRAAAAADPASVSKTATEIPHLEEERGLDLGIRPNQLDQFDQPTYHFRLYMMNDEAVRTRRFGPQSREQRIVIAESAVTSVQIDDVEISAVTGMTKGTGTGISTNFSFMLTQPFGATLLDEIVSAAHQLGIQNYAKAPFFLELSFRGRSREDTAQSAQSDFSNLIWVWPIVFTKMSIDVNVGGSTYAVEASLYSDVSYTNHVADISKPISIDAETVGEFYQKLALQLNLREAEKEENATAVHPDTYSFIVDSDIYNEKIVPDASDERQNRAATFSEVDGKMRITFQPPADLDKITQNILSLTNYFQTRAKGTDEADAQKKANQGEDAIFQTLYRIVGDSQMGNYDPVREDYQRHHTYLIIPYTMTTIQTQSNSSANVGSPERFAAIYKRGLLTKQYDYLFTGLNDQVLDFEIVFNFNWYAALPIQGGRNVPRNTEVSAGKTEAQKRLEAGIIDIADAAKFIEDKIAAEFPNSLASFTGWSIEDFLKGFIPQEITDLQATVGIGGLPTLPNVAGLPDPNNILNSAITNSIADVNQTIIGLNNTLANLQNSTQFGRVVDKSNPNAAAAQENLEAQDYKLEDQTRGEDDVRLFNTTYIESTPSKSQGGTGAYSGSAGQNMLSALFEQANSPLSADLLDITLKIKGDPYWLEPTPIGRQAAPLTKVERAVADRNRQNNADRDNAISFNGVETTSQQTYFVFRNFTPDEFSATTGLTPKNNKNRNMLSGVYGVKTVQHSFSGGQFTQELHAIRDPQLNLQGIDLDNPLAGVSSESSAPDTEALTPEKPFTPVDFDDEEAFRASAGEFASNNPLRIDPATGEVQEPFTASSLFGTIGTGDGRGGTPPEGS